MAELPLVLLMIARSTQVKRSHWRTLENKIYYLQILEGTQHSRRPHVKLWVEGDVERVRTRGFAFVKVKGTVLEFHVFALYWPS